MAIVEPDHPKQDAPLGGPSRWERALVYSFTWLPAFVLVSYIFPHSMPLFEKLSEKRELPELTGWIVSFVSFDVAFCHLPIVFIAIALIGVDAAAMRLLYRGVWGSLWSALWLVGAGLVGVAVQIVIVRGMFRPMYRNGFVD